VRKGAATHQYADGPRPRKRRAHGNHATRDRRIDAGMCIECGVRPPRLGVLRCDDCAHRERERVSNQRAANLAAGLCTVCRGTPFASGLCERCWFRRASSNNLGHVRGGEILRRKFHEQGGTCWYTGRALTPGVDATLDHTLSTARGGTNDADNLRWVHWSVNDMKGALSAQEFVGLCAEIVAFAKRGQRSLPLVTLGAVPRKRP
jgi:hypothetical protein